MRRSINIDNISYSKVLLAMLAICSSAYGIRPNAIPELVENIQNPKLLSTSEVRDGGSCYVTIVDNTGHEWVIYNNVANTNILICDKICDENHSIRLQWNSKPEIKVEGILNEWKNQNEIVGKISDRLKWRNDIIRLVARSNAPDSNIIAAIRIHQNNGYAKDSRNFHYSVTKKSNKSYTVKITAVDSSYYGYRTIETRYGSMVACKDMSKMGGKWYRNYYCWSLFSNQ